MSTLALTRRGGSAARNSSRSGNRASSRGRSRSGSGSGKAQRSSRNRRPGEGLGPAVARSAAAWTVRLFGVILGSALLVAVSIGLLASYRFLTTHPYFTLTSVQISGEQRLTESEILALSGLADGGNTLAVNMRDLESRLLSNRWIESVTIRRELPGTIAISVSEREAFFWVRHADRVWYADREGRPIDIVGPDKFASLPVLMIERGAEAFFEELPVFARRLEDRGLPFGLHQVSVFRASPEAGLEIVLEEPGIRMALPIRGWENGLTRLRMVWDDLARRGELARVNEIRVRGEKVWVTVNAG